MTSTDLFPHPAVRAKMFAARTGDLAASAFPDADHESVVLVNRWILWTLGVDDYFDQFPLEDRIQAYDAVLGNVEELLSDGATTRPTHPVTRSLVELWHTTCPPMSHTWRNHFRSNTLKYLTSMRVEAEFLTKARQNSLDVYVPLRRDTFWCRAAIDLVARVEQVDVVEIVYSSEEYQELCAAAADVGAWTNDFCTAQRELSVGEAFNLPALLMRTHGYEFPHAASCTLRMIQDRLSDLLGFKAALLERPEVRALPAEQASQMLRCLKGVENWVAANHEWHRKSLRYRSSP
ncbi:hypothetical protein ACIQB5_51285 [Streptomyces sp. NPDC088560]|uniref:terpene synthase family protein n=1 Tax=Streptomyces sp. NPDC088560 TaxID=3365868 RepID=UPI00381BA283